MSLGNPRPIPQRCGFLILGASRDLERRCRVSETIHLFYEGGSDPHKLLNDVKERYLDVFAELRPGVLMDLKMYVDSVKAFLDLSLDGGMDFRVKLMDYAKVRTDAMEG